MSATSAIVSPVTAYMRIIKHDKNSNSHLKENYNELVDLITVRLQSKHIEDVVNGLLEKTFEIRLDIITWLADNFSSISDYTDTINNKFSDISDESNNTELFDFTEKILFNINKITLEAYKEKGINDFKEIQKNIKNNRPTYKSLQFLRTHPQSKYLINLIDESLKLDMAIVTSILILKEEISLDQKRIQQELIPFLNKTIDRFGAYSIFTEFWTPDKNDHTPETYKMQILADTIRMNNGMQPLYLENEEDLEDVGLALAMQEAAAVKEYVDTEAFLHQLRGFVAENGGSGKMVYRNWNNIQETLLVLEHKTLPDTINQSREERQKDSITEKTIEEVFANV